MNIWIVNPYGTLPSEGWREYRSLMLARALAEDGHDVTWWISDFEHRRKSYRSCGELSDPLLPKGVRVMGVHSTPYIRNISLQRIRYEINYGREFGRMALAESPPDVIVMGDPALFFGAPVLAYRARVGCKLILDVIDLWPELFTVTLPKLFQPLGRFIFSPLYRKRVKLIKRCDAVVAVSQDYMNVVLQAKNIDIPNLVSYLGIDVIRQRGLKFNPVLAKKLREFRAEHSLVAVYAGTLGDAYDMDLLLSAVAKSAGRGNGLAFVVAGDGPRKNDVDACARKYPQHLLFLGALPPDDLVTLYQIADVGLMTYVPGSTVAMPVKFFDYLVAGLAVLSSLQREVHQAIDEHQIGMNYRASDLSDFLRCLSVMSTNVALLQSFKAAAFNLAEEYDTAKQYSNFSHFIERVCVARVGR